MGTAAAAAKRAPEATRRLLVYMIMLNMHTNFASFLFFFLGGKGLVIGLRYIDDWGDLYWL